MATHMLIAILLDALARVRRWLRRFGVTLQRTAYVWNETQRLRREAQKRYPYLEL